MPRRFASATRSKRPTLPPPDFGFIRSTALPSLRRSVLAPRDADGAAAAACRDSRTALRAATPKTKPATTKMTSSSTAPRAIIATAAPTRAAIATTPATGRIAPRRVSAIQPAAAATAKAASTISSVTKFLTRSTPSATTTAAMASSATHAARRPALLPRALMTRASPLRAGGPEDHDADRGDPRREDEHDPPEEADAEEQNGGKAVTDERE